jgi:hypothetical protein
MQENDFKEGHRSGFTHAAGFPAGGRSFYLPIRWKQYPTRGTMFMGTSAEPLNQIPIRADGTLSWERLIPISSHMTPMR